MERLKWTSFATTPCYNRLYLLGHWDFLTAYFPFGHEIYTLNLYTQHECPTFSYLCQIVVGIHWLHCTLLILGHINTQTINHHAKALYLISCIGWEAFFYMWYEQEINQWASCWSALPDRLPIIVEDLPFVVMNRMTLIYQQISNSTRGPMSCHPLCQLCFHILALSSVNGILLQNEHSR